MFVGSTSTVTWAERVRKNSPRTRLIRCAVLEQDQDHTLIRNRRTVANYRPIRRQISKLAGTIRLHDGRHHVTCLEKKTLHVSKKKTLRVGSILECLRWWLFHEQHVRLSQRKSNLFGSSHQNFTLWCALPRMCLRATHVYP